MEGSLYSLCVHGGQIGGIAWNQCVVVWRYNSGDDEGWFGVHLEHEG